MEEKGIRKFVLICAHWRVTPNQNVKVNRFIVLSKQIGKLSLLTTEEQIKFVDSMVNE